MPNNPYKYPLHPGQTHAEPYYCTIPLEEYEALKKRVRLLEHVCKINGIVVPGISDYTMSQPPFKEDA